MITFAAIVPHPPLLLPDISSVNDRKKVEKTLKALEILGAEFKKIRPDSIIISSPHPDWGINVPLHFLAKDFNGQIQTILTGLEPPQYYFEEGKKFYKLKIENYKLRTGLIASGDLSHCLKEEGPYGFHPHGPRFDKTLIEYLTKKDIENILKLNEKFPEAGECGLRSFCFLLGILEASKVNWEAKILSYEGPFGVGYLVAQLYG
ncbi:MAG: class III extradiol dioxygenase subunit B-like domain-containing protein [Patescibacteria group bacterium]